MNLVYGYKWPLFQVATSINLGIQEVLAHAALVEVFTFVVLAALALISGTVSLSRIVIVRLFGLIFDGRIWLHADIVAILLLAEILSKGN